jgi:hypothetical protein
LRRAIRVAELQLAMRGATPRRAGAAQPAL